MKCILIVIVVVVVVVVVGGVWYFYVKQLFCNGLFVVVYLQVLVDVCYDECGVLYLYVQNQIDFYCVFGYVYVQDCLFQMEMLWCLVCGELVEVFGFKLVDIDCLFCILCICDYVVEYSVCQDKQLQFWKVLEVYLDGVNQFQENNLVLFEFDLLGIFRCFFIFEDILSIVGYMVYSFVVVFCIELVLIYICDELGSDYLCIFDFDWYLQGVLMFFGVLGVGDWKDFGVFVCFSQQVLEDVGLLQFEGSNVWVVVGSCIVSGKFLLVGDLYICFVVLVVWYEVQLSVFGFEFYGYYQVFNFFVLLGYNCVFGWSLMMFQNDDFDLVVEKVNLDNFNQVWYQGEWVDLQSEEQEIVVKGVVLVKFILCCLFYGLIVNDVFGVSFGKILIVMWWVFFEIENLVFDVFYQLNCVDILVKVCVVVLKIYLLGFNLVWVNVVGDIGWWVLVVLLKWLEGVNLSFIFDGSKGEVDKFGFYLFVDNLQEENLVCGYIVFVNFQLVLVNGWLIFGYYNLVDCGQWLDI